MSRHNVFLSSKYFNLCFFNAKNSVNQSAIIKTRILTLRQHYYLISRFYSNLSMIPIMSFRMRENPRSCFAFHCFRILAKVDFRNLCLLPLFLNDSLPLLTCNHFLFFFYSLSWFFLRSWSFVSLCWHFFLAWRTSLGIFSEKFCLQWIIFFSFIWNWPLFSPHSSRIFSLAIEFWVDSPSSLHYNCPQYIKDAVQLSSVVSDEKWAVIQMVVHLHAVFFSGCFQDFPLCLICSSLIMI